jgi:hypothetical protein
VGAKFLVAFSHFLQEIRVFLLSCVFAYIVFDDHFSLRFEVAFSNDYLEYRGQCEAIFEMACESETYGDKPERRKSVDTVP